MFKILFFNHYKEERIFMFIVAELFGCSIGLGTSRSIFNNAICFGVILGADLK